MPHTYKFADAEQTTVVRDDGTPFPWQKGVEPGAIGAALGGYVGEVYRIDGCPMPAPFSAKSADKDKDKGKLRLKLKRGAGKTKAAVESVVVAMKPHKRKPARKPKTPRKGRKHK